ncbi:uncharacterized protein LOC124799763 isoform X3 [Schistocerca piceifrons]|uniref:uncharacterized protein LOC124799763 isoform X3 n=1 Tax=Schistocerca piceifrons TaxID=274613 RepID=UPI001F5FE356|nr:uncharacterized protein LOC124799763 isoform X3 [Schistocerca piceifrons]
MNKIKKVDLYLTDEMKEVQELSQSVEYCQKQNKNESLEQINCDLLSNKEKLSVEPESVRAEIFESNSEITSYEVPDISSSFHIDIRESLHLDSVVTPESSVTAGPIKKDPDPAVSFLDKSLMEQVNITQYLINSHHTVYNAYCTAVRNLSKNYQPVTLENTMQFIKHSKKKKRKKMASP